MLSSLYVITVNIVVVSSQARSEYKVIDDVKSWKEANRTCELAAPKLINDGWPKLAENIDISNGTYWVAYATVNVLFQFNGCSKWRNFNRSFNINGGPSLCYSGCQTKWFGIGQSDSNSKTQITCFCSEKDIRIDASKNCTCSLLLKCFGTNAIAVYTVPTYPRIYDINGNVQGKFVSFLPHNETFYWGYYDTYMKTYCQTRRPRSASMEECKEGEWLESIKCCIEKGLLPLDGPGTNYTNDGLNTAIWTGMFKDECYVNVNNVSGVNVLHYGVLEIKGKDRFVVFTSKHKPNKALCYRSSKTSQILSTTRTTVDNRKLDRLTINATTPVPSNNNLSLYISLPVIAVFLVGAVLAGVMLYIRRSKARSEVTLAKGYSEVQDLQPVEDYVFTEPIDNVEQPSTSYNQAPTATEEDAYDISGSNTAESRGHERAYVYHHLMKQNDDTYDTTRKVARELLVDDGNIYHGTVRDDMYNISGEIKHGQANLEGVYDHMTGRAGDIYDVMDKDKNKQSKETSDNVYN